MLLSDRVITRPDDDLDQYRALFALEKSVREALEPQNLTSFYGIVHITITLWAIQGTPEFYAEAVSLLRNGGGGVGEEACRKYIFKNCKYI